MGQGDFDVASVQVDGRPVDLEASVSLSSTGNTTRIITVVRDISERQVSTWASVIPQHMQGRAQWVGYGPHPVTGKDKTPFVIGSPGRLAPQRADEELRRLFARDDLSEGDVSAVLGRLRRSDAIGRGYAIAATHVAAARAALLVLPDSPHRDYLLALVDQLVDRPS